MLNNLHNKPTHAATLTSARTRRVLALDPGYERLGIALLERNEKRKEIVLHSECFRTSAKIPFAERLALIGARLTEVIAQFQPTDLAIETLYFAKNQKTALSVAEARGVLLYVCSSNGLGVYEYQPSAVKIAITSHGMSDKKQMMAMIPRLVTLPHAIEHDDEFDAIAVGITHLAHVR
jgi:crossover junction endodeoxyribonuclease RuvC